MLKFALTKEKKP